MALELPRWQNVMVLVTMIMSVLIVDVWCGQPCPGPAFGPGSSETLPPEKPTHHPRFFYSKSLNCCIEIRGLLDDGSGTVCPPALFTAPCREFVGNCADVKAQFEGVQDALPDDYECHQFPDETAFRDKLIVGLICCAVSLPFTLVLAESFAKSNEPEFPENQLNWPAKLKVLRPIQRWDWARTRPGKVEVMCARFSHEPMKIPVELFMARACVFMLIGGTLLRAAAPPWAALSQTPCRVSPVRDPCP